MLGADLGVASLPDHSRTAHAQTNPACKSEPISSAGCSPVQSCCTRNGVASTVARLQQSSRFSFAFAEQIHGCGPLPPPSSCQDNGGMNPQSHVAHPDQRRPLPLCLFPSVAAWHPVHICSPDPEPSRVPGSPSTLSTLAIFQPSAHSSPCSRLPAFPPVCILIWPPRRLAGLPKAEQRAEHVSTAGRDSFAIALRTLINR